MNSLQFLPTSKGQRAKPCTIKLLVFFDVNEGSAYSVVLKMNLLNVEHLKLLDEVFFFVTSKGISAVVVQTPV